ncbi:hypothetical protein GCM10010124_00660 [Pilimelia terevasa]|uniref:Uncharacterized protein n=1 Tax=Pilimelia terevasa TaxID=53372 RepID=A0A8J3FD95_9ACTN|nr:hypothetical protein [Pilimelia terevasa]GGK11900.1 hypothetical protein GCM10010124_00660 [Pilimelia terevasa]
MSAQWSDPFADAAGWVPRPPPAIVPRPAAAQRSLRGWRVLTGVPGHGWRGDLRADNAVVQGSRTLVPVLPEAEWYRAETDRVEVFAPLVPVERVWVETVAAADTPTPISRLVSLDQPPPRAPVPVLDAGTVAGRRLAWRHEDRFVRDLRAVSEIHDGTEGEVCVRVAAELDWYRWAWSGAPPKTRALAVSTLWLE